METSTAPFAERILSRTILDHGELSLIDHMGGDKAVIRAARVSNGANFENWSKGEKKDQGLINYLIEHKHWSPFDHAILQLYVKAPLFVAREWFRHRSHAFNEVSGRYVDYGSDIDAEFYIPEQFRIPGKTNKQGSVIPTDIIEIDQDLVPDSWGDYGLRNWNDLLNRRLTNAVELSYQVYRALRHEGVAKELARIVLPLNLYTEFYDTLSARSLIHFISLRSAEDAQWEIQEYSRALEKVLEVTMPMTYQAAKKFGAI